MRAGSGILLGITVGFAAFSALIIYTDDELREEVKNQINDAVNSTRTIVDAYARKAEDLVSELSLNGSNKTWVNHQWDVVEAARAEREL